MVIVIVRCRNPGTREAGFDHENTEVTKPEGMNGGDGALLGA